MSEASPERYIAEVKTQGLHSPAFVEAVTTLQSDADREAFVRGLLKLEVQEKDGKQTIPPAEVDYVRTRLKEVTEKAAFEGLEQAQGTASQAQLDAFNARYKIWMQGLEPWEKAVDSALQGITVLPRERQWAPHPAGSNDYGVFD